MIYKQVKSYVEKLVRRFYIFELLVILLLCSSVLGNFGGFSNSVLGNFGGFSNSVLGNFGGFSNKDSGIIEKAPTKVEKTAEKTKDETPTPEIVSFLRNNLVINWNYYGYMSASGKKKAVWPDGDIYSGPVFLSATEKKPYYLFNNFNINFGLYPLRLFRNFTKGDGTLKFAEDHKEVKAVVFYQEDLNKLKQIKREKRKIVWDTYCLNKSADCNKIGIMFFEN